MSKIKYLLAIAALSFVSVVHAQQVHQCTINGKVVFQAKPCPQTAKTLGEVLNVSEDAINERKKAEERAEQEYQERLKLSAAKRGDLVVAKKHNFVDVAKLNAGVKPMPFNDCKKYANDARLSAAPQFKSSVISDNPTTYLTRICRKDGSIVLACSAKDNNLVLTKSNHCSL